MTVRKQPEVPGIAEFSFVAGELALDFANTLGDRGTESPNERLRTYGDLVWWGYAADLIGGRDARRLLSAAGRAPERAQAVVERARRLREALHRAFSARTREEPPGEEDLALLNEELGRALSHLSVRPGGDCCQLQFAAEDAQLDRVIWSVARSAADLLTAPRISRIKQCHSPTCDWLFLDGSRNNSRRWCSMSECGNRSKARRHYARHRSRHDEADA